MSRSQILALVVAAVVIEFIRIRRRRLAERRRREAVESAVEQLLELADLCESAGIRLTLGGPGDDQLLRAREAAWRDSLRGIGRPAQPPPEN